MTAIDVGAWSREWAEAEAVVSRAATLCEGVRADLVESDAVSKADRSPVTVADYGSQAVILAGLARAFPNDPCVAEEEADAFSDDDHGAVRDRVLDHVRRVESDLQASDVVAAIRRGNGAGGASGRFWTLDPIDGTKGFLRKDQYAIALALIEEGEVVLGMLGCPALSRGAGRGVLFGAVKGGGAAVRPLAGETWTKIRVSTVSAPGEASFCESFESGHSAHDVSARVAERLAITRPPVRMDSQCKYAVLARGEADIYMRLPTRAGYEEKIWDHAAGVIVVQEAGGQVSDMEGRELNFGLGRTLGQNRGVIATNGQLHAAVIEAVGASV